MLSNDVPLNIILKKDNKTELFDKEISCYLIVI